MIIVFNGDTLDLMKRLEQYSDKDQKLTLDFMLQNFKILESENGSEENKEFVKDSLAYLRRQFI